MLRSYRMYICINDWVGFSAAIRASQRIKADQIGRRNDMPDINFSSISHQHQGLAFSRKKWRKFPTGHLRLPKRSSSFKRVIDRGAAPLTLPKRVYDITHSLWLAQRILPSRAHLYRF